MSRFVLGGGGLVTGGLFRWNVLGVGGGWVGFWRGGIGDWVGKGCDKACLRM